jgi:SAM-dependent methyltransferase
MSDTSNLSYFGREYLDAVSGILTAERTAQEVSFILEQTGLDAPAHVADFGCGHGRHAIEFARRGFTVTGVDLNEQFLRQACAAAPPGLSIEFVQSDYLRAQYGPFDLIVSLFGSFGFSDDETNASTLRAWCHRLVPGGFLVLELWHRDMIVANFQPQRVWQAGAELEVDEQRQFDPLTSRLHVHYSYRYRSGAHTHYDIDVRLYTAAEIAALLKSEGVTVTRLFGSVRGEPYSIHSRYLALVARKRTWVHNSIGEDS